MKRAKRSSGRSTNDLSREQVANLFRVCPSTITRWAREGRLPYRLTLGGHHRFLRDEILMLVKKMNRMAESTKRRRIPGAGR
jgi:excisionase family DNA binding protein